MRRHFYILNKKITSFLKFQHPHCKFLMFEFSNFKVCDKIRTLMFEIFQTIMFENLNINVRKFIHYIARARTCYTHTYIYIYIYIYVCIAIWTVLLSENVYYQYVATGTAHLTHPWV